MFTLLGILMFILIALMMLSLMLRHLRRKIRSDQPPHFDFTIGELHALRNSGHLSQEEFERAQANILRRGTEMQRAPESLRPVNETRRGFDVILDSPPPTPPPPPLPPPLPENDRPAHG